MMKTISRAPQSEYFCRDSGSPPQSVCPPMLAVSSTGKQDYLF
ncbi:rCG25654, partial [Rattus norvegicus]